ncbi:MAG: CAP domain-containing protein [Oscillospiraceae bacterium]|nr:CAP domain-containing protein [Oscillospiraceae bacterium]
MKKHAKKCLMTLIASTQITGFFSTAVSGFSQTLYEKTQRIQENTKRIEAERKSKNKLNSQGGCPALENAILELLNPYRANISAKLVQNGKTQLELLEQDRKLIAAARQRSQEMLQHNYFGHTRPDKRSWVTILQEKQYKIQNMVACGENIQKGKTTQLPSAKEIIDVFKRSKVHNKNMLGDWTHIGIGFRAKKLSGGGYIWFVTQLFARLEDEQASV